MNTLDLESAAAFLGLHRDTLRARAAAGIVPGAKIGKEWRFLEADLVEYFRSHYRRAWQSICEGKSGGSICGTAGDELDALLERATSHLRKGSTTNLRLVSGKKSRPAANSPTRSRPGSKRSRVAETS